MQLIKLRWFGLLVSSIIQNVVPAFFDGVGGPMEQFQAHVILVSARLSHLPSTPLVCLLEPLLLKYKQLQSRPFRRILLSCLSVTAALFISLFDSSLRQDCELSSVNSCYERYVLNSSAADLEINLVRTFSPRRHA